MHQAMLEGTAPLVVGEAAGVTGKPEWLLPESTSVRWLFRQDVAGYAASHYTLNWDFSGDAGVAVGRAAYWCRIAQITTIAFGSSEGQPNRRVTSILNFARLVRAFAMWACYERRCSDLAMVGSDDIRAYEEYVGSLELKQSSVEQRLSVLTVLWECRREIGSSLRSRPYRSRGELKKVAKRLGRANGHTRTLAPEPFFKLLDVSLKLVSEGEKWADLAERYCELRDSSVRPSRAFRGVEVPAGLVIRQARDLLGACVVVVLSLLGARKHEIALFTVGDARRLLEGAETLTGVVTKVSNGTGGMATERPAVPELQQALDLIARLTGVDLSDDKAPLFRTLRLDARMVANAGKAMDSGQIYRLIQRVVALAQVDLVVRPHMFRRAFSMIFVWRYEFGDLTFLSRMLYHADVNRTMTYVSGDDTAQFLSDAERDLARSIMERALTGKDQFAGGFGGFLDRLARRLRASSVVLKPEQVDDWLEARLAAGQLSIRPGPHGYCVLVGDRGAKAACSRDGRMPDYVNRTDEHCSGCGNFLLTSRSRAYWESRYQVHAEVARRTRLPLVKEVARSAMMSAEKMLGSLRGRNV